MKLLPYDSMFASQPVSYGYGEGKGKKTVGTPVTVITVGTTALAIVVDDIL